MNGSTKYAKVLLLSLALSLFCAAAFVHPALSDLARDDSSTASPNDAGQTPDDGTNLWLQISSVTNGTVSLILHHPVYAQTGEVYEVWSKTNLIIPSRNIETDVWAVVNQNWTPFTVPTLGRPNLLIWARDWTGIDENSNGVPDWWEYEHPGVLPPVITAQPTNQTAVQGNDVTFSVGVSSNSTTPLSYQWYFNGTNLLAGAINTSLTLTNVQLTNAGNYSVVVTNAFGSATSSNVSLTVFVPPIITRQPADLTVNSGSNAIFSVNVSSNSTTPLSYQWYFNGTNLLAGATNPSLTLTNVQLTNAGNYSVMVTNTYGSVTSSNANLTVIVPVVPMVAIGGERIMELTTNGDVISWGGNKFGELGDCTHLDSTNPIHVVGLTNITKFASGLNHSLAIDANGALWAWGTGDFGQLGVGLTNGTNVPVQVLGMTNSVVAVAAGHDHSIGIKSDGTVWTWGDNESGQLGNGGTDDTNIPAPVKGLPTNAVAVAAGALHSLALLSDGTVWAWGADGDDQLGDGLGTESDVPVRVPGLSNIVAICAGDYHSLAIGSSGIIWAWGNDGSGQLGDGGSYIGYGIVMVGGLTNAVGIAAGDSHSLAVDGEARIWAWGNDGSGQLGDGGPSNNGGLYYTNLPMQILGMPHIISIAAGLDASAALDGDGNVWQWGNSDGDGINWQWGDENGFPMMAPAYFDFFNGRLPNLTILSGNNQTPHAGLEFPQPLIFQVTDTNGVALSNAPVSVEVIAGDIELRTISGGDNYKGLRLTTDTNGEVGLIGYADRYISNTNCLIRVLAASRQRIVEADFNETLISLPTINITSPTGGVYLVGTNQTMTITVNAQAGAGGYIQEVDYSYTQGGDPVIGVSTSYPFSIIWTNTGWTNLGNGSYIITAVAVDDAGDISDPANVSVSVDLDSDGNGLPDYWEIQYFGTNGLDPNSSPDGNGQTLLYDYQNGFDPTDYYDGIPPNLQMVSGTNLMVLAGAYAPVPLTALVTDGNGVPLTNAPVIFTATLGVAELAAATNGLPANNLSVRADSNGLASAWVYFPPDAYDNGTGDIISVQAGLTATDVPVTLYFEIVTITNPPNDSIIIPGSDVSLGADVLDSGGTVSQVQFFFGTNLLGTATTVPCAVAWTIPVVGIYPVTAEATDNNGVVSTSSVSTFYASPLTNMVDWWRAEGNTLDSVGTNNGIPIGNVMYARGEVGQAFDFDGTNSFVATSVELNSPQDFTLDLWFKTTTTQGGVLMGFGDSQFGNPDFYDRNLYMDNNGVLHLAIIHNFAIQTADSMASYNDGRWHHVAATLSDSAGSALYVDGSLVASNQLATTTWNYSGWWSIGQNNLSDWPFQPSSFYFNGLIDEVSIYDSPLDAADIRSIYNAGSAGKIPAFSITLTNPPNNAVVPIGCNVNLAASVSDPNGLVTGVQFFQGNNSLGLVASPPYSLVWTNPAFGKYTLTAVATDNNGLTVTSLVVNLIVDTPPSVTLTNPANNAVFAAGSTINLAASASDPEDPVAQVQFFQGTNSLGTVTVAPFTLAWTNPAVGTYSLTAVAMDGDGLTTTSGAVNISIDLPPIVSITTPTNNAYLGIGPVDIPISVAVSDAWGIQQVQIFQGTNSLGIFTSPPYATVWNNVPSGNNSFATYNFTAVATGADGLTTAVSVVNVVVDANNPEGGGLTEYQDYLYGANPNVPEAFSLWIGTPNSISDLP